MQGLRKQWAPGGLLHCGQGKWYPGESLPRWTVTCYWRQDGIPVWTDDKWLAELSVDYGFGIDEAGRLIRTLADRLGVSRRFIRESYEDILYYLYKEQRLPVNVTPTDPRLADPEERSRMVKVFEQGLGAVVGYVLPLQHGSWISGPWPFRGDNLFLLPGDSPSGLRLPLDSLPWVARADLPLDFSPDPMGGAGEPLPDFSRQLSLPGDRPGNRWPLA